MTFEREEEGNLRMSSDLKSEIQGLEAERFAAMSAADVVALGRLLHDDLVYTHSSGDTDTKVKFLDRLQSGSLRYLRLDLDIRLVRIAGDTAVVLEVMDASVLLTDAARDVRSLGLAVWVQQEGGWRLLAYHPLPQ